MTTPRRPGVADPLSKADFEALATEISGEPLDDLFDAWLRSPELPELPDLAR